MNFEDEHYVRIYTKQTKTVKKWGWEGRVLFRELSTVVDKAGVLDDIDDPVEDIALMVDLPVEIVEAGLPRILKSKSVEIGGGKLVIPNYIEAQTARKSDKVRAKESRERRAALARASVTDCDGSSQNRTSCDETERERTASGSVTDRDDTVTDCDEDARNRDEVFAGRPAASLNAMQRSAEINRGDAPPLFYVPPEAQDDVKEIFEAWRSRFGANGSKLLSRDPRARIIRDAIDGYGKPACLRVLAHAKNDGMVSGRDDQKRVKHDSVGYILGNQNAFERILKAADEAKDRESRSIGDVLDQLSAREVTQ